MTSAVFLVTTHVHDEERTTGIREGSQVEKK